MKRLLFPFFNDSNRFLFGKWWFRLVVVLYVIVFVILPFYLFISYANSQSEWCYNSLYLYYDDNAAFQQELAVCTQIARESWLPGIGIGVIGTIVLHYFIQFVFFKILIGYIVLGGNKKQKEPK